MKAAIYIRVSTEEQVESGLGLAAQEQRCRAFALAKGWHISGVYSDEGVSGMLEPEERPAGARLMEAAGARRFDVVIVMKIDRLARRAEWVYRTLRELEEKGVGLVSVSEPFDTSSAMGKAFVGVAAVFAELERDLISDRTRLALAAKKAGGGVLGGSPLGYRVRGGRAEPVSEELETVERIRELRRSGLKLQGIARQLAAEGRRTKRGGRWAPATVWHVLQRGLAAAEAPA